MNQKALTISAMLAIFVLVLAGGLVYAGRAASNAANAANAASGASEPATSTQSLDPQIQQAILQREAAYKAEIDQANQEIIQLQAQLSQAKAANTNPPSPQNITPQQAAQAASQATGQTQVYSVETVQWNNTTVYQVTFSSGDIVRVGMDGTVVNIQQAAQQATTTIVTGSSSSGSHGHESEHESEGGD